jgi:hypothetical protein
MPNKEAVQKTTSESPALVLSECQTLCIHLTHSKLLQHKIK